VRVSEHTWRTATTSAVFAGETRMVIGRRGRRAVAFLRANGHQSTV
jgi:hypothetical protein